MDRLHLPVDQSVPVSGGIGQEHADLTVLRASGGAGVLTLHASGLMPFFRKPVSSPASTAPGSLRCSTTKSRTSPHTPSTSQSAARSSRCIPSGTLSPARSARVHPFLHSRPATRPGSTAGWTRYQGLATIHQRIQFGHSPIQHHPTGLSAPNYASAVAVLRHRRWRGGLPHVRISVAGQATNASQ